MGSSKPKPTRTEGLSASAASGAGGVVSYRKSSFTMELNIHTHLVMAGTREAGGDLGEGGRASCCLMPAERASTQ